MVRVPHLRPKKIGVADKKTAERMRRGFIRNLAIEVEVPVAEKEIDDMLRDQNLREVIGLCTYASDLLQRLQGVAVGPATLALWRSFAWTPQGSPKKDFALTVDSIMEAQQAIAKHLTGSTGG
jgi:hypothetical protein